MKVLSIIMLVSAGLFIMFIMVPFIRAGLCSAGLQEGMGQVEIMSATCPVFISSCVGIAGFVFLIIFTTDVSAVDLECDEDKYSSMDTV